MTTTKPAPWLVWAALVALLVSAVPWRFGPVVLQAAAAHVETQAVDSFGGSTTESVTITFAAGNLGWLCVGWNAAVAITSVADGVNSWTLIDANTATGRRVSTYYDPSVASGSTTITVTWATDPGFNAIVVHEVSGTDAAPLDDPASTTNSQASPGTGANAITSGSVTPAANGSYLAGCTFDDQGSGVISTGTSVAWVTGAASTFFRSEYFVQATAAAVAATFTTNNTFAGHTTAVTTFKEAGGGGGGVTPRLLLLGVGED